MLIPDSSVIISLLLGVGIGLLIWRKWRIPHNWLGFAFCFVLCVIAIIGGLNQGAVILGFGDYFGLGAKPVILGLLLVLMIGFLRTRDARSQVAGKTTV